MIILEAEFSKRLKEMLLKWHPILHPFLNSEVQTARFEFALWALSSGASESADTDNDAAAADASMTCGSN